MTDTLVLAESFLSWILANYATNPACGDNHKEPIVRLLGTRWSAGVVARSLIAAVLLILAGRFDRMQLVLAGFVFVGSILLTWIRRCLVAVRYLVEFELVANASVALLLWLVATRWGHAASTLPSFPLDTDQLSALCICAALLLYMIHGGNFLVRGILKKAGELPDNDQSGFESQQGYAHGRLIGQIERIIVVLIVIAGNLPALAFFFAAKGLIRSKELENRARADYFLLGSLASFLAALSAGLILQEVLAALWK